jgi:RimJ/RimL family protein N-acetyltransferase
VTSPRPPIPLPDPPLVDGDLQLRPWAAADAGALASAWADPEVTRWSTPPGAASEPAAEQWIGGEAERRERGIALDLAVAVEGAPLPVGEVGLAHFDAARRVAEVGWWVSADFRGRGIAGRALRLVADWALDELSVAGLFARIDAANPASGAVAAAAGFERQGTVDDGTEVWFRRADPAP